VLRLIALLGSLIDWALGRDPGSDVAPLRMYAVLFALGLAVYGTVAWDRVGRQSPAPHFVFQADAWLHGRASIQPPLKGDDWAKVETVRLDDGSEVSGRRLKTRPSFKTLGGDEIPLTRVKQSVSSTPYVSFPPFPALLMVPGALISGRDANDTIPTLLVAALILPLCLLVLRRLRAAGFSARSIADDLWLVLLLGFGTVLFFSSVQGKVWFTAHVVGVALALVYAWASIEAKRPIIAGLALGAAALTRTPMAFMFPLFLLEAWRISGGDRRAFWIRSAKMAAPVVAFAALAMAFNAARFGSPFEFGHSYLDVRQQAQIEQFGLFSYHYLARNLAVGFTLLPDLLGRYPFVQIGGHGLALWFTTPVFVYLLWPRKRPAIHRTLWITVACVAVPTLFYQNSGWFQFGYRFSLDYTVFLVMLLAIGMRPLTRIGKSLIVVGILINLFGAVTFDRQWQFYRGNYDVIVAH
jgi:hypothetical protein